MSTLLAPAPVPHQTAAEPVATAEPVSPDQAAPAELPGSRPRRRPIRLRPAVRSARSPRTVTHARPAERPAVEPPLEAPPLLTLAPRGAGADEADPGVETGTRGGSDGQDTKGGRPAHSNPDRDEFWDAPPLRSLTGPAVDPARVCASILQVGGEAMRGLRPLVQLSRWVDDQIFTELAAFAPTHGARTSVRQRLEPDATATVLARARLRRIHVTRLSLHVAECTALVEMEGRVRAVAVRLEERRTSWRATTLAVV